MFSNPLKNLKALSLREDSILADLGAGTGQYSLIAGLLAPKGKVYAVEIQRDFLETIKGRARDAHVGNLEIIWGNVEKLGGTKIGDKVVDVVIASNILFQVEDKEKFIEEIKRILKPKGRVLLIDWTDMSIMGRKRSVPEASARSLFEKAGFVSDHDIDAGAHHYGMILIK